MDESKRQAAMRSKADQAFAEIGETWPPALHRFYENCVASGFDKDQAFRLTVAWLESMMVRVMSDPGA